MSTPNYPQQPEPQGQPGTPPSGHPGPYAQPGTPPGGQPVQQSQPMPGQPPQGYQQQGYPQQAPGYGQQPPPPPPPPPAPKRKKTVLIAVLAVCLVAIGIGVYFSAKTSPGLSEPGDCIRVVSGTADDANVERLDCNDAGAVYKVGTKLESDSAQCPDGDYAQYTQTSKDSSMGLCLLLNAKQGDCFGNVSSAEKTNRTDCGAAEIKITKIIQGQSDEKVCGDENGAALIYSQPATTICVVKP